LPLRLAKDQTEINRIIAEASKGSQFYEVGLPKSVGGAMMFMTLQNEKKKDKELTEKIAKILKQRDGVLKGVDIRGAAFLYW
jgi:DNA polymerase kappa